MSKLEWERRIARAGELADEYPPVAEILHFYARLAALQQALYEGSAADQVALCGEHHARFEELDLSLAMQHLPALLSLVQEHGPSGLARAAGELQNDSPSRWQSMLAAHARGERQSNPLLDFFPRTLLQPLAEAVATASNLPLVGYTGSACPLCKRLPLAAVLRPEGEGAKRSLLCSFCLSEWNFRRIVCPACGEESNEQLPRYSAAEFPHIRVEACDSCQHYLKSVDLTVTGLAVPVVDEIASVPLDLWAAEHGYSKIELNLLGC